MYNIFCKASSTSIYSTRICTVGLGSQTLYSHVFYAFSFCVERGSGNETTVG